MAASLDDILTATKNLVSSVNQLGQAYLNVQGQNTSSNISNGAATVVSASTGRVVNVSVLDAGSTTGIIYDSNSTNNTSKIIYIIPKVLGVYNINIPVNLGILVVPGTNQKVLITYS